MLGVRYMKRKHPYFDVELLGHGPSRKVESRIRHYQDMLARLRGERSGLSAADVAVLQSETKEKKVLWIGVGLGIDAGEQWQCDHARKVGGRNLHLLGLDTPFENRMFDMVVNVDLWRFLMPEDLSRALVESMRVAKRLLLVASARSPVGETGVAMADLDYITEAYGFPHHIKIIKDTQAGRVMQVTRDPGRQDDC